MLMARELFIDQGETARTRLRAAVDQNRSSEEDWFNPGRAQLASRSVGALAQNNGFHGRDAAVRLMQELSR